MNETRSTIPSIWFPRPFHVLCPPHLMPSLQLSHLIVFLECARDESQDVLAGECRGRITISPRHLLDRCEFRMSRQPFTVGLASVGLPVGPLKGLNSFPDYRYCSSTTRWKKRSIGQHRSLMLRIWWLSGRAGYEINDASVTGRDSWIDLRSGGRIKSGLFDILADGKLTTTRAV